MSLLETNGGLSAADMAAVLGNNRANSGMWGGDGAWWILILLLFGMNGGWGNGFGNGGLAPDMQRSFDQQATTNSLNSILAAINGNAMATQNCCCENRQQTADVKFTVAQEAAATRSNTDAKVQAVMDKLCELELAGIKQNYENRIATMQTQMDSLREALTNANFRASQNAQTAAIVANNDAQTVALEQYLSPTPRPAYIVQNPNCCSNVYTGCSCMQ